MTNHAMKGGEIMELKRKKDRMEVLMSNVTFIACTSMASLVLTAVTLILVVVLIVR